MGELAAWEEENTVWFHHLKLQMLLGWISQIQFCTNVIVIVDAL